MKAKPKQSLKTIKYFSVGKNTKPKKITNLQIKSPNCSGIQEISMVDKSDQDVKWLQKLVNGFEWYRIKKDTLFNDDVDMKQNKESFRKNMKNSFGRVLRQSSGMMRKNSHRVNQQPAKDQNTEKQPLKNNSKIINSVRTTKKAVSNAKTPITHRIQKSENKMQLPKKKQSIKKLSSKQLASQKPQLKQILDQELNGTKKINNNESQTQTLKSRNNFDRTFRKKEEGRYGRIVKNNKSVDQRKFYANAQSHKKDKVDDTVLADGPVTEGTEKHTQIQADKNNKKANDRNKTIEQLKKQLNFNRYEYYTNNMHPTLSQNQIQNKKQQRKLNSLIGQCRNKNKPKQGSIEKKIDHIPISSEQKNVYVSQLITQENQKLQKNVKDRQNTILENLPKSKFKYAVSTRNSALMTEENSYVIEKICDDQHYSEPMELPVNKTSFQWDIIGIFNKLDRKNTKRLNSNNCAIQSLSRQLRYILGGVLQQILYTDVTIDLDTFIIKVQDLLNTSQYMQFKDSNQYFELKQLAAETQRKDPKADELDELANQQHKIRDTKEQKQHQKCKFKFIDVNKSEKKEEKSIRFATFQNQSDEQAETKFTIPQNQEIKPINQFIDYDKKKDLVGTTQKFLQLNLQKRLSQLNQLKLGGGIVENQKIKQKTLKTQQICQQSLEIEKLEQLNRKIQRYLIDQSLTKIEQNQIFME